VRAWLDRPGTRVVRSSTGYREPWAGRAALHATLLEARTVSRAVRRDHQVLHAVKVRRSVSPPGSDQVEPGRPRVGEFGA
jgi:hypothetical protein